MKKIENGEINPEYLSQISEVCEAKDIKFFEDKIKEAREYLSDRMKDGYPMIKTSNDLRVECQLIPFCMDCIKFLNKELTVDSVSSLF